MFVLLMWIHGFKNLLCNVPYFLLLASHYMPSLSLAFHLFSLCNSKKEKQPLPQVCGSAPAVVKYKQEFASHCTNESSNRHSVLPNNFTLHIQMFVSFSSVGTVNLLVISYICNNRITLYLTCVIATSVHLSD
jgi:hypothetical protein